MDVARTSGFSLVELLAVLGLMAVLTAIALPGWNRLVPAFHLDSSARQVQSELHGIRMRAAAENLSFQLVYAEGGSGYTIQKDGKNWQTKSLPEGIFISKAGAISFSPRRIPTRSRRRRAPRG